MDPGRPVVSCPPCYYLYDRVSRVLGLEMRHAPLDARGFEVDWDAVRAAADPPGVVLLTSPNNPTGQRVNRTELGRFLADTDALVLADEAYFEFAGETVLDLLDSHDNLLVLRTLSKAWGVAGLRLGYLLGAAGLIAEINKVTVPYAVDALTQALGVAVMARPGLMVTRVQQVRAERERLRSQIEQIDGLTPLPSDSNFFLVRVDAALPSPAEIVGALKARDVVLRDVSGLTHLQDCFRITVGDAADSDAIVEGLRSL